MSEAIFRCEIASPNLHRNSPIEISSRRPLTDPFQNNPASYAKPDYSLNLLNYDFSDSAT